MVNGSALVRSVEPLGDDLSPTESLPKQKKRALITNISAEPLARRQRSIPTEADTVTRVTKTKADSQLLRHADGAYLGHCQLTRTSILGIGDEGDIGADREGWAMQPKFFPPGVGYKSTASFGDIYDQTQHSSTLDELARSFQPEGTPSDEGDDDDGDVILPAYGDSDAEYDSETWKEIEEEAKEEEDARNTLVLSKVSVLSSEAIDNLISKAIQHMEELWTLKKLPKLERGAYKMWEAARRHSSRPGKSLELTRSSNSWTIAWQNIRKRSTNRPGPRKQKSRGRPTFLKRLSRTGFSTCGRYSS